MFAFWCTDWAEFRPVFTVFDSALQGAVAFIHGHQYGFYAAFAGDFHQPRAAAFCVLQKTVVYVELGETDVVAGVVDGF